MAFLRHNESRIPKSRPAAVTYGEGFDAVRMDYEDEAGNNKAVYLNPYTGQVIKVTAHKAGDFDFFSFILNGHLSLWLPREIGAPIVSYAVLTFFIVLVTGVLSGGHIGGTVTLWIRCALTLLRLLL